MSDELLYQLGLTLINGVGDVTARNLVAYCGSAEAVFKAKKAQLLKIPGIAEITADKLVANLKNKEALIRAEEEMRFIEKNHIEPLFFTSEKYPHRLKYCNDSPIMLYFKGNTDLNAVKVISVVGTRTPTRYGRTTVDNFIAELKDSGILVVSGMAYGIDIAAHEAALANGLDTIGVLAHGLDTLYPSTHRGAAQRMLKQGGLLSDYMSCTKPDKENFPSRNRIVAGMCDAVIVIESKLRGGSLITAEIANSYNKDVFAFPGRTNDECSGGCNAFIKRNKAVLIEHAADLMYCMGWEEKSPGSAKKNGAQLPLLVNLNEKEQQLVDILKAKEHVHVDEICHSVRLSVSEVAGILLQLEFSNIVRSLPGKLYTIN
ncbi:MAG: DNA-processing protein DprA [Bacteroidia bacterium]